MNEEYLVRIRASVETDSQLVKLLQREIISLQESVRKLSAQNKLLVQSSREAGRALPTYAAAAKQSTNGLRSTRGLLQNVSYQLTDFAVQTQNGTSALRAFSLQAPQVAGALGAAGIGGAAGVAAFAVASLGAALAPAIIQFVKGGETAKTLAEAIDLATEATNFQIEALNKLSLDGLIEDYNKLSEVGKSLATNRLIADIAQGEAAWNQLATQVKTTLDDLTEISGGIFRTTARRNLAETLGIPANDTTLEYLREVAQAVDDLNNNFGPASIQDFLREYGSAFSQTESGIALLTELQDALTQLLSTDLETQRELLGLIDQVNPGENLKSLSVELKEIAGLSKQELPVFVQQMQEIAEIFKKAEREAYNTSVALTVLAGLDPNSEQYRLLAQSLGEAAPLADRIRFAFEGLQQETANMEEMRQAVADFAEQMKLTAEQAKALREALGVVQELEAPILDIGAALGEMLGASIRDLSGALVDFVADSETSFRDFTRNVLKQVSQIITQMLILKALQGTAFGGFLGIPAAAPAAAVVPQSLGRQAGPAPLNARSIPSLQSQTGQGKSVAAAPTTNVNVKNYGPEKVNVQRNGDSIDIIIGQVANDIMNGGGKVSQALELGYGMTRARTAY